MKSPSLDNLYAKLERQINLVESYTEISNLGFIMRACRLKPFSYMYEKRTEKIVLYRKWIDEFGNSLELQKKKVVINYRDCSLTSRDIPCTDLYHGLSIDRVVKMSKLAYVFAAFDVDTYHNCYLISMMGLDNYLRSYMYLYDSWQMVSPLHLGLKNLRLMAKFRETKYFLELSNGDNSIMPCVTGKAWLSFLPASYDFRTMIAKDYKDLVPIFGRVT